MLHQHHKHFKASLATYFLQQGLDAVSASLPESAVPEGWKFIFCCTVENEIKCSRNSEVLHIIVHDTKRTSSCFSNFRVVSRTISFSISESPLHFIFFFLTVWNVPGEWHKFCNISGQAMNKSCATRRRINLQTFHFSPSISWRLGWLKLLSSNFFTG